MWRRKGMGYIKKKERAALNFLFLTSVGKQQPLAAALICQSNEKPISGEFQQRSLTCSFCPTSERIFLENIHRTMDSYRENPNWWNRQNATRCLCYAACAGWKSGVFNSTRCTGKQGGCVLNINGRWLITPRRGKQGKLKLCSRRTHKQVFCKL